MKHPLSITSLLVFLFVVAQIVGVSLVYLNISDINVEDGQQVVQHDTTAIGDRPDLEGASSFAFIMFGVAIGTGLLLLLIKLKAFKLWKIWFLVAVWLALAVAFGVIMPVAAAFALALIFAVWKVHWPNPIVHNLTEVFMYAGIAVLIAPLFDLVWMIILLIVISAYDMFAVWKSKHMVTMAEEQTKQKLFAGLYVPKGKEVKKATKSTKKGGVAILGGGDIAFPLLFVSVVLVWLIERGVTPIVALYQTLIIVATATVALTLLFAYSKKGRFYPAMPFLAAGCLLGLAILSVI